ncbi:EVI5-like protein [Fusarium oxysporum f. sp. albedinis]|nr:EVI5-like protein [Fusarium oxysporum f. sp. albedinis]
MTSEQLDAYIMGFRTAEITDQLRTNDLNHTSGTSTRCLSPTPEYAGTRETEQLVQAALKTIPAYRPPYDYPWKRETFTDKIYLPVADFPYLSTISRELTSSLVGKATGTRRATANDCREPLHYLITADLPFKVDQAKRAIQDMIETATTTPDRDNKRKTEQLRSLAIMNGTFCDYERSKENMLELTDSSENHKKTRAWPCAVWI